MKLGNIEVKESKTKKKKKIKISAQKIFNLVSFTFILACCIFYGGRFITLYLENHKTEDSKTLTDIIIENNSDNGNFKNINGDYYFEGKEQNNYIRYSNLNWRIIRVNNNNTITAVLDNSITALAVGSETNFKDSYFNLWLNNNDKEYTGILENNLNNSSEYLTYTYTCNDKINDTKTISCKDTVKDYFITIPSLNDYVNTGSSNSFMNNEENYYLINSNIENKLWYVDSEGKVNTSDGNDILGVKPVITFKNNISLIEGNGTKETPYIIEETNGLFGSYVKLGEDIWRIYDIDGDNIKLSLETYAEINDSDIKYKYSNTGYYHNDTKDGSLAYYLKNTYLPSLSYSDLINEVKYSNGLYSNTTNYDYREVLKTEIDTKVATLSIGNIFLNPTNTNYYTSTGISKDDNLMYIMKNDFKLYTEVATTNLRVIPVISIDKNRLTNGDGTKNNPLEVNNEE